MGFLFSLNMEIHQETLPPKTKQLVDTLQSLHTEQNLLNQFYLSGGTGLSLQLGHRESEDLDFFSEKTFNPEIIQRSLTTLGSLSETELATGTLNTFLNGVKLQFLEYPYRLIKPTLRWKNIILSSIDDIACTKLQTIGMRGSKKDFIDLYFLFDHFSLPQLFEKLDEKYPTEDYSKTHILKSLIYFEDAESQPMPRMHSDVSWENVKEKMRAVSKAFVF